MASKCLGQYYSDDYYFDGKKLTKISDDSKAVFVVFEEIPFDEEFVFHVNNISISDSTGIGVSYYEQHMRDK